MSTDPAEIGKHGKTIEVLKAQTMDNLTHMYYFYEREEINIVITTMTNGLTPFKWQAIAVRRVENSSNTTTLVTGGPGCTVLEAYQKLFLETAILMPIDNGDTVAGHTNGSTYKQGGYTI